MYPDIRRKIALFEAEYGLSTSDFLLRYAVAKTSKLAVITDRDIEMAIRKQLDDLDSIPSFISDCKDFALIFGLKYKQYFKRAINKTLEFGYIKIKFNRNKIVIYY